MTIETISILTCDNCGKKIGNIESCLIVRKFTHSEVPNGYRDEIFHACNECCKVVKILTAMKNYSLMMSI